MSNLEQCKQSYKVTIENEKVTINMTLIEKEKVEEIIDGIEETHKNKLEGKENEIKQLKGELEKTKTSLQEAQETLEQERSEYKSEKEEYEMKKKKLKKEIESLTEKIDTLTKTLKSKDDQLKQEEKAHNETKKAAVNKVTTLQEELQGLQRDAKKDLYTLYKQICPEKDNYGIQGKNLYTFLITSGQVETLEHIVESAKQSAINNPEQCSKEKELFNQLFDSMQGCYNLERIVAKVGDDYDENYYKVEGDSIGKISEVILDGFKKNGNTRKKPLVKVKK
ncbi:hypothetical protein [Helicobacter pullorum]|uniref:hypothetical protein n=1 Tax=Helicobacter pullorum TaxID=35818 RepID=UPI001D25CE99|nr:hypothetical protein [Helicobacter pullorum]HJF83453.1 hypothetical protein [Helicobacter pullorum]